MAKRIRRHEYKPVYPPGIGAPVLGDVDREALRVSIPKPAGWLQWSSRLAIYEIEAQLRPLLADRAKGILTEYGKINALVRDLYDAERLANQEFDWEYVSGPQTSNFGIPKGLFDDDKIDALHRRISRGIKNPALTRRMPAVG